MSQAIDFLIRHGQQLKRRKDQYKVLGSGQQQLDKLVLDRHIVKHRITQEKLIMKIIPNDAKIEIKM